MRGGQRRVYLADGAWRRNKLIDGADAGENKRDAPLKLLHSFTGLKLLLFHKSFLWKDKQEKHI